MKKEETKTLYSLKDLEKLETLRGEVNLQAHLLKADLKDKFEALEKNWNKLNSQFKTVQGAAKHASHELTEAASLLAQTVQDGYQEIKHSLGR